MGSRVLTDEPSKALALWRTRLSRLRGTCGRDDSDRDLSIPSLPLFTGLDGRAIDDRLPMASSLFGIGCSLERERSECTRPCTLFTGSAGAASFGKTSETGRDGNDRRVAAGFDGSPEVRGGGRLLAVGGERVIDGVDVR